MFHKEVLETVLLFLMNSKYIALHFNYEKILNSLELKEERHPYLQMT